MRFALALVLVLVAACGAGDGRDVDPARDGMTEIVIAFDPPVDPARVRDALIDLHASPIAVAAAYGGTVSVRLPLLRAAAARQEAALVALRTRAGGAIEQAYWTTDRLVIRTTSLVPDDEVRAAIASAGLHVQTVEGDDHHVLATILGPDGELANALGARLHARATVVQTMSVGPQRR